MVDAGSALGETSMHTTLATQIAAHPSYQSLKRRRTAFGLWLTLAMMVVYYGFILLVAFDKPLLATRLGEGVMTLGVPLGQCVIVFTVAITGLYLRRANREFDRLTAEVQQAVQQ